MVNMEISQENTTTHQNQSDIWNGTGLRQASDHAFTKTSLGLGSCIIVISVLTMFLLLKHRKCIEGTEFWQQLVFLCSTDILTGISTAFPPLGYLFFDINADIYYSLCALGIFLYPLSVTLSAGNCCVISIYRYVILKYIDKPNTIWHKYASPLMILSNGLLCILTVSSSVLVVSVLFGFHNKEFCDKVNKAGQNEYKATYIIGTIIMLTMFLLCTNVFTISSIVKLRSMNRIQPTNTNSTQSQNIIKRNRHVTITFVLVVMALDLATIPALVFLLVSMNKGVSVSVETTEVISCLLCMNSLLNPFIYSLRSTEFRNVVLKDINVVLSRIRCSHDAP